MSLQIRNSIKVLLFNSKNELLLLCCDDPTTTSVDGTYHGKFWINIGGEIEPNESVPEAALREIFEETGLKKETIKLGPIVWFGEFDLIVGGIPRHLKQQFIIATTKKDAVW